MGHSTQQQRKGKEKLDWGMAHCLVSLPWDTQEVCGARAAGPVQENVLAGAVPLKPWLLYAPKVWVRSV